MEISLENSKYLGLVKNAQSVNDLEQVRIKLLGKKGEISNLLRSLGQMEAKERQKNLHSITISSNLWRRLSKRKKKSY